MITGYFVLQCYFCLQVVGSFQIGRDLTRIGAVVFSENAQLVFDMNRYQTEEDIQNAIMRDVPYLGTFTNFAGNTSSTMKIPSLF